MRAPPIIFYKGGNTYGEFKTYEESGVSVHRSEKICSMCVFCEADYCSPAPCHGGLFVKVAEDNDALLLAILRGEV